MPVPSTSQGWLALLLPSTAPVTGVPALPGVPLLSSRVVKVSGWPWLSAWLTLSSHENRPTLSPSEALVSHARKLAWVLYSENGWLLKPALACASKALGRWVVNTTTAPTELPGKAAENGPYITSTRSISSGVTMPQRGGKLRPPTPLPR